MVSAIYLKFQAHSSIVYSCYHSVKTICYVVYTSYSASQHKKGNRLLYMAYRKVCWESTPRSNYIKKLVTLIPYTFTIQSKAPPHVIITIIPL